MAMTKISTDSPADMPKELCDRYKVRTIPLHVILDEKSYDDGVTIVPKDIYKFYDENKLLPKTAAVSVSEYEDFFRELTSGGSSVVHISLSSEISSTFQNASIAAAEFNNVFIVDSKSLCCGMALLVIKAAEMAEKGVPAKEIATEIEKLKTNVKTSFILDNLLYLHKGGRCSGVAAFGANVLGIKPSIVMNDGVLTVGKKYRGKLETCQVQYMHDVLKANKGKVDDSRVILARTDGVSDEQMDLIAKEIVKIVPFKEVLMAYAGCTITSHCGAKTFAVLFMTKK